MNAIDQSRIERLKEYYKTNNESAIIEYLEFREEGYTQYQAALMAGLIDPQ